MRILFLAVFVSFVLFSFGQTNPVAQSLPYSQDFSGLLHTSTTYPAGFQGWNISGAPNSSYNLNPPSGNVVLTASASASTTGNGIHNYNGKIGVLHANSNDNYIAFSINTTGSTSIVVNYDIMTIRNPYDSGSNTRINEITLQYRIGVTGDFITLTGIEYQNNTTTQTGSGVTTPQNLQSKSLTLPAGCNNQAVVQLRLAQRQVSGSGSRPSFAIDNISITGTSCTAPSALTYTSSSMTSCVNLPIATNTVSSISGTSPFTYTISPALPSGLLINSSTGAISDTATVASPLANYTVTATNSCGNTTQIVAITVNPLPTITAGGPYGPVCENGADISLTGSPSEGTWSGSGVTDGMGASGTFDPSGLSGSITVTYSYTDGNGCTNTPATTNITVNPTPTITAGGPYGPVCENGSDISLTGSPSGGTWSGSGVIDGSGANGTFDPSGLSGSITVTYSYTDGNGCTNTPTTTNITVNPTPTITAGGPYGPVCENGADITLTGSPSGGTWSGSGVTDGMGASGTFDPSGLSGSTVVTYSYTDGNGCTNTPATTNITVNPTSTITAGGPYGPVCENGADITLTGSPSGGTWSGSGVTDGMGASGTFDPSSLSGSIAVTYSYTDGNGCTNTPATTNITVNPTPSVTCPANQNVCINTAIYSISGGTPSGGMYSGNGVSGGMFNPSTAGIGTHTITYSYTDVNSCTNTCIFTITVNSLPTAMISGGNTICLNQTSTLTATGGSSYLWSTGDMTNSINVGIGTYFVTVTDGNGCMDAESYTIYQNNTNNNGSISGIYESYAVLNITGSNVYFDLHNSTGNPDFNGYNLGSFTVGGSALIKGGEIKTYKNNPANICGGKIYYNVFPSAGSPGVFNSIMLPFFANLGGPNQQWSTTASNVNFLNSLTAGSYKIAIYVDASGDGLNPMDCGCDPLHVQNNSGAYFIADFTVTGCSPVEAGTISGDNILCVSETTTLTLTGADANGTWSSNDTDVADVDNSGVVSALSEGTAIIKYKITGAMGCPSDSALYTITVNENPVVNVTIEETSGTADDDGVICNGASVTLTATGGTVYNWDNGITNGDPFSPSSSQTYNVTVTDGNSCSSTESETIMVNILPTVICPSNQSVCINTPTFTLSGGSPGGGTYSGIGVSGGMFNPSIAGIGIHTITYSYTDGNSCTNTCTYSITVNALPTLTCPSNQSVCINTPTFALSGGSPNGGTYSGVGVSMGMFNPSIAGVGLHTITYSYTDGNICTNTCTYTITVNALPSVTCPSNQSVCINTPTFTLSGGSPNGGTYSGTGVSMGMFDPSTAGIGLHTITYNYTDGNSCTNTCTYTITVNALPDAIIFLTNSPSCEAQSAKFQITGTANSEIEYNIDNGSPLLDTLDNLGITDIEITGVTNDITLNLTNVKSLLTNCEKALNLSSTVIVNDTSLIITYATACNTYLWTENNITYTSSVIDTVVYPNFIGCDSTIILNLTINNGNYDTSFISSCTPYTWSIDGNTYGTSGTYEYYTTNMMSNCQDTFVLILTVGSSNIYIPGNVDCFTSVSDALLDAMPGDTVYVDAGTYFESFIVPYGVILIINAGSSVTNNGTVCNEGIIIRNGGMYLNQGLYIGRGKFMGDFVNSVAGEVKPGACGN